MTRDEYDSWKVSAGCVRTEDYSANGIDYVFALLPDGWTAIFERDYTGYAPLIQAADEAHARSYCDLRAPVRVPLQRIC